MVSSVRYVSCSCVNECCLDMNWVDWPHIVEERCGQASGRSQTGTLGISGVEENIGDGMTVFSYVFYLPYGTQNR
jgi:hypothetical protein